MPRPSITSVGIGFTAGTFQNLLCAKEQTITPHSAGAMSEQEQSEFSIHVRCRRCGSRSVYHTDVLPTGYEIYLVRVTGEDGPHLPPEFRPLPFLEQTLSVVGLSAQDAHERAEFAHSLKFSGHLTRFYINGELHLDERF